MVIKIPVNGSSRYCNISHETVTVIPQKHLSKIFDRFYQADDSSVRNHVNSGIGLGLVKELVVLHGGDIYVESREGKGTVFTVKLFLGNEISLENSDNKLYNSSIHSNLKEIKSEGNQEENNELPIVLVVEDNIDLQKFI